jgi:hypothetical protein
MVIELDRVLIAGEFSDGDEVVAAHHYRELEARVAKMQECLLRLDERGGLGHDMHDAIKEALGVPSGKFCRSPRACLLNGRCQSNLRGIACND